MSTRSTVGPTEMTLPERNGLRTHSERLSDRGMTIYHGNDCEQYLLPEVTDLVEMNLSE